MVVYRPRGNQRTIDIDDHGIVQYDKEKETVIIATNNPALIPFSLDNVPDHVEIQAPKGLYKALDTAEKAVEEYTKYPDFDDLSTGDARSARLKWIKEQQAIKNKLKRLRKQQEREAEMGIQNSLSGAQTASADSLKNSKVDNRVKDRLRDYSQTGVYGKVDSEGDYDYRDLSNITPLPSHGPSKSGVVDPNGVSGGIVAVGNSSPVILYRSKGEKLTEAEQDQIMWMMGNETDPLAMDVLIWIRDNGIPYYQSFDEFMSKFAHFGWDERSDAHVAQLVSIIKQDRANDWVESLVVFDADTGYIILDRIGQVTPAGQQYVGLQQEEIDMIQGQDVILIHNHPSSLPASYEDLQVAWMAGVKSVTIMTPEGFEYVYVRGESGMRFEEVRSSAYGIAPPTLGEAIQLGLASIQQTIANTQNPPEHFMFQDVFIHSESDGFLNAPEGMPIHVAKFIGEMLWNQLDNRYDSEFLQTFGRRMLTRQWSRLTRNETGGARSDTYSMWTEILGLYNDVQSDIKFYEAANRVTALLAMAENPNSITGGIMWNIFVPFGHYDEDTYRDTLKLLDTIGVGLMDLNTEVFSSLIEDRMIANDTLHSPYYPDVIVNSPLNWDVHMVWREQAEVTAIMSEYNHLDNEVISLTNDILNIEQPYASDIYSLAFDAPVRLGVNVFSGDTTSINWANNALNTSTIDFAIEEQRRAIGLAWVFQLHGLTEEQFLEYHQVMIDTVNTGGNIPSVEDILGLN